tara:strand:- start:173 stop:379 length:207 start_codon:yes stop_codon:yes gene_type:complete
MKIILVLQIFLFFSFTPKNYASRNYQIRTVCERFAAGKIDAYKTLEALELNVDDYSIGVNNTAKIFCS